MDYINDDLIMYLKKLIKTIETQASFNFGNIFIVNQNRVDDILCCIDVNFPKLLKVYSKEFGIHRNIKSFEIYDKLIASIKCKPPFTKTVYAVNFEKASALVDELQKSFVEDIAYIKKTHPNMSEND